MAKQTENNIKADIERLCQSKMLAWLNRDIPMTEMVTVYLSERDDTRSCGIYCALIPISKKESCLGNLSWDLTHGHGMPGSVEYYTGGDRKVEYLRFGDDTGIEPLIIDRKFHGMREDYVEISEEFRFFHNLYHDQKHNRYYKYDSDARSHFIT
jgi:hypothetical protein